MTHTATPAPAHDVRADVSFDTVPACDAPDGCGAGVGQPCAPGCPSIATDEYGDAFADDAPEVLIVTADDALLAELQAATTAANATTAHVSDVAWIAAAWEVAGTVLLGADVAERAALASLPYRGDVLIAVGPGEIPAAVWSSAATIGARHVVQFPAALPWVVEKLGGR